ncbi:sensor histidine kinase [Hymenobacter negativus]|uniref:histidine kinase n=1 Tax=Hymenobacter negativus TaxID=2795026 RepID=A0ABS3QBY8_9BACT|nr:HAMP domain-containing sensor histidine kinase [Hymenobacter negativus]MBO2008764.1 HAMP domain-containing histidine kinase [Hymenobacter negativus]
MKSLPIRLVVLLGVVSIIGILAVQGYWVRRALAHEERQFDQRLAIALREVATRLAAFRRVPLPAQSPVSQVASNYYVVNVNSEIDANLLDYYLRQEFGRLNLHLDYEYAIYDCGTDHMVYGRYVSAAAVPTPTVPVPATRLPRYSRYTYYFGLYLPHRAPYFMSQLNGWALTSGLLLVVLVFFGYALFVILRQKRLAEVQRDFINAMSHEFKTPITTIAISAEVLTAPDIASQPQRLLNYASIIREENRRLSQQVDKVLQMAKSERSEFRLHREAVDLAALLPDVIRQFDVTGKHPAGVIELSVVGCPLSGRSEKAAHTSLTTDNEPKTAKLVWADPVHLANVLFNLLDNAVKYTIGPPVVRVALAANGPRLCLTVTDEGIGIAPAHQGRVFDKFFRVPAANDLRPAQGFGLGLYYVRNVATAHGWRLALRSRPGLGCTFTITFPPVPAYAVAAIAHA